MANYFSLKISNFNKRNYYNYSCMFDVLWYFTFLCPFDSINTLCPMVERKRFSVFRVDHRVQILVTLRCNLLLKSTLRSKLPFPCGFSQYSCTLFSANKIICLLITPSCLTTCSDHGNLFKPIILTVHYMTSISKSRSFYICNVINCSLYTFYAGSYPTILWNACNKVI